MNRSLLAFITVMLLVAPVTTVLSSAESAMAVGSCPQGVSCATIFDDTTVGTEQPDARAVELGVKFRSDAPGEVVGIRFFKTAGNSGPHTGTLWSASGQRLANVIFGAETASGWQEAAFSTPVDIQPNVTYIASYHTASGRYATGTSFATAGVDRPPLHALREGVDGSNGVYRYGSGGVAPESSWASANYLVDVLFAPVAPVDGTAPAVTATKPQANAIDADPASQITAAFSEAMDAASITASTVELRDPAGNIVPATVAYDVASGAVLDPTTDLTGGTRYVATVKGGPAGVLDIAGNPLPADFTWAFRTTGLNATAPIVTATTPTAGSTGASVDANLTVVFSEGMDPTSINSSSLELRDIAGRSVVTAVTYDAVTSSAIVDPAGPLAASVQYRLTVRGGSAGVRDSTGVPLETDMSFVFTTAGADAAPPSVLGTWPLRDAADFGVDAEITAIFTEPMAPGSISGTTVQLRDSNGNVVAAAVSYDPGTNAAVINPTTPLANSREYTATIHGGAGGVTDVAGNPMVGNYSWTFATIPAADERPSPDIGPGGPLLIVKGTSPFGGYLPEMMRGEGLNLFTVRTTSTLTASALAPYETLVLGETTLSATQVDVLTAWVNAGGNLIAMRPPASLAGLLGLTAAGGTLAEGYVGLDTSTAPGKGIESATMQFHGSADLYRPRDEGTRMIAQLYRNATEATGFAAATTRSVGLAGGSATAFTYDLARSVVYTRQGNPDWSGVERDGISPIRSNDLFYPDYIDRAKVAVPQADEQQRFLANIITHTTRDDIPVPRFWYLPRGEVAAIVMTADEHNGGSVPQRFGAELARSSPGCVFNDWDCIRSTSYQFVDYSLITDAQAATYEQQGFELALHPDSGCAVPSRAGYAAMMSEQLIALSRSYPSITPPTTSRNHCVFWMDYTTVAEEEEKLGIHLDTNYYYWPPSWAGTLPGMFTGSAMAQRFLTVDGRLLDVYQAATQLTDESGQAYPSTAIALMDGAINKGYFGAFVANLHTDGNDAGTYHSAVIAAAEQRSIPIITGEQLLEWTDGRNASSFANLSRTGGDVTFTLRAGEGANGLQAMLPIDGSTGTLRSISRGGVAVSFQTKQVKGVDYAVFTAVGGEYIARYQVDTAPPTISQTTAVATGTTSAEITWTTNEASTTRVEYGKTAGALGSPMQLEGLSTSHRIRLSDLAAGTTYHYRVSSADAAGNVTVWPAAGSSPATFQTPVAALTDTSVADFGAGVPGSATYVANSAGGEVILAPSVGAEFEGSGVPAEWMSGSWTGGAASFSGGAASVDGSWLRSATSVGSGRAVEFAGTFSGAAFQSAGFAVTLAAAGESWAMFGTNAVSGVLQARTRDGGGAVVDVALGSQFIGSEHVFRIEWDSTVRFFVDGTLVHTAATVSGTMRPLASDYATGGGALTLKWMRLTPHASSGSFLSRIHDAGSVADWGAVSWSSTVPTGSGLAIDVRTGNTPTPDAGWTAFSAVGAGQDVASASRYLQYRARLSAGNGNVTPTLSDVLVPYTIVPPSPDTTPPVITGRSPAANATNTPVGADVSVTFDEAINPATFTASTFTLRADGASGNVPAAVTASGKTSTLNPNANLAPGTRYTVTVAGSVADAAGNPLGAAQTWSFTTGTSVTVSLEDTSVADFGAGVPGSATYVANSAGGEVILAPSVGAEFEGSGVPAEWMSGSWTGGAASFSGGAASVDGSWLRSATSVGSGRAVEFAGTFSGAAFQSAGFAVTLAAAGESWAMFGTNAVSGVLQARTRDGGGAVVDVALGSQFIGSEHVFRIEWDSTVRFFVDGTLVHTAATVSGTMRPLASDYATGGGALTLKWMRVTASVPTVTEKFDGGSLPAGWTSAAWNAGGGSTVAGGNVAVNGALLRSTSLAGHGSSIEFVATFGGVAFQHGGFGVDLAGTPRWAIFSTAGTTDTLYARTNNNGTSTDTALGTGFIGSPHTYRIDWLADRIVFSIDGRVVHTQNAAITGGMGPVVSDYAAAGPEVLVASMLMTATARTGVFTSRVLDAGSTADWQKLDVGSQGAAGTGVVIEIRTGPTPSPDSSWTAYTAVSAGADIPNSGRYLQYRATLSGTTAASPVLERIVVGASPAQ